LGQKRVGNTLELIGIGKNFLNGTPAAAFVLGLMSAYKGEYTIFGLLSLANFT
jgi:hypothetical protein